MNSIILDDYEVANLRSLLKAITTPDGPLIGLASGDWAWQILDKLPESSIPPNRTVEANLAMASGSLK